MTDIRRIRSYDTGEIARLLARNPRLSALADETIIAGFIARTPMRGAWYIAEDAGKITGFQLIGPYLGARPEVCEMGSFLPPGHRGMQLGTILFNHSVKEAKKMGYAWINVRLHPENESGEIYYQSRGFRVRKRAPKATLMRYDI